MKSPQFHARAARMVRDSLFMTADSRLNGTEAGGKLTRAREPCALRYQSVADGKFKLISRDARWEELALPIHPGCHASEEIEPVKGAN